LILGNNRYEFSPRFRSICNLGQIIHSEHDRDAFIRVGTLLFSIDPRPFQIELDRENAALELSRANLTGAKDGLALAESDIEAKKASFDDAATNLNRGRELLKESVVSQETVDNLERAYKVAQAELGQSRAAKVVKEQEVAVQSAQPQSPKHNGS
jgi:membrane fusion protein (multidrug efflux system)